METDAEKLERLKAFDRDAYLAALERPVFHAEGRTITGRLLSAEQWFALEPRLEAGRTGALTPRAQLALAHDIIRTMFPPETPPDAGALAWWRIGSRLRAWRERRAWRRRAPDVLTLVQAMPWGGQIAVAAHFCAVQVRAQTGERLDAARETIPPGEPPAPTTDGTRSLR